MTIPVVNNDSVASRPVSAVWSLWLNDPRIHIEPDAASGVTLPTRDTNLDGDRRPRVRTKGVRNSVIRRK